jgi:hypothetical protein
MKKIQFILLGITILILSSFTIFEITNNDEKKMIGSWEGSETDNQRVGLTKHWIQNRYKDGTFVLIFSTIEDCKVEHMTERGKWYIKDGLFYEKHNDGKTDVYSYEILDDDHIKFKAKSISVEQANIEYQFVDTRLKYENE